MKSTILISILALCFSISSFAGIITKIDDGIVSWTVNVNKKQDGVLTYSRMGTSVQGKDQLTAEENRLTTQIVFTSGIGGYSEIPMTFNSTDERSQESVEAKIKEILSAEMKKYPAFSGAEAELKIYMNGCSESGFLKKKLTCRAKFKHSQVFEISIPQ